jgi:predicted nucleic acid-binding protein
MDWLHKMRAERAAELAPRGITVSDTPRATPQHRPLLYLETSIFGFYFDEETRNALRREAVRLLFAQAEMGLLRTGISRLTVRELMKTAGPRREELVALAASIEILACDEDEVERLAGRYLAEGIIPAGYAADALHAATATVCGCGVLVTLNLKHLANEWAERLVNSVNLRDGYRPISIRTPEEVLHYEE